MDKTNTPANTVKRMSPGKWCLGVLRGEIPLKGKNWDEFREITGPWLTVEGKSISPGPTNPRIGENSAYRQYARVSGKMISEGKIEAANRAGYPRSEIVFRVLCFGLYLRDKLRET